MSTQLIGHPRQCESTDAAEGMEDLHVCSLEQQTDHSDVAS